MTKIEPAAALKAFATLRFEGDALDVAVFDDLLGVRATLAYGKGETYSLGRRGTEKVGRTGYWFLNTKTRLETADLNAHVDLLIDVLTDGAFPSQGSHTFDRLKTIVERSALSVLVTLFWFGRSSTRAPDVSPRLVALVDALRGEIETDFTLKDAASGDVTSHAVP